MSGQGGQDGIGAVLDHVAVAAERAGDLWPRYAGELGGEWLGGGETAGFYSAQVVYSNGMKLEGLEPRRVEENDFLRRFLDHSGPGPHHLTFKVPDIGAAIAATEAAGFALVGVNLADPRWKEAFVHPKAACGIVVQLAQSDGEFDHEPRPDDLPAPRAEPARLDHVTHAVADPTHARELFQDLLGGVVQGEHADATQSWVDLAWPSGGVVRLVTPVGAGPLHEWIGDRPGRLHHLAFTTPRPEELAGAVPAGDRVVEVPAEANLGVRLLVSPG
jgi:methylmalonyl-CoA/ethylmalonyl-CoA epimerase